jgi:hypothetical protein
MSVATISALTLTTVNNKGPPRPITVETLNILPKEKNTLKGPQAFYINLPIGGVSSPYLLFIRNVDPQPSKPGKESAA